MRQRQKRRSASSLRSTLAGFTAMLAAQVLGEIAGSQFFDGMAVMPGGEQAQLGACGHSSYYF
jgi:hypothetical protein